MTHQRDPLDGDRPGLDDLLHEPGEGRAVLAQAQAGVGAQHEGRPPARGQLLGVRRAGAVAVTLPVGLVLAEPVHEHHQAPRRLAG